MIFIDKLFIIKLLLGIGDWGLGIGDWGLGIGDWAEAKPKVSGSASEELKNRIA